MNKGPKQIKILESVVVMGAVCVLLSMVQMMSHFSAYIWKFHTVSLFDDSLRWFVSMFDRPGIIITYVGRFLTQFCCHPNLAIALLLLVYALIFAIIYKTMVRDVRFLALAAMAPACLFLAMMTMGYDVVLARADAQIFSQPVGVLFSLLAFWLLTIASGKKGWTGKFLPVIIITVLYPLLGFYALLGGGTFAVWTLLHIRNKDHFILPLISLICIAAIPYLYYLLIFDHTPLRYMWLVGTPYLDFSDNRTPALWLLAAWVLLPLLALPEFTKKKEAGWISLALPLIVYVAVVVSVYQLPDRRALLHRQFAVEKAMDEGRWADALSLSSSLRVTNDVLVAYRNCALYFKGELPQKCWKYSFDTVPLTSGDIDFVSSRIAGPRIFYYSGLLNFAARWSFEHNMYQTYGLERIKILAKVALFNGEKGLARKYIEMVSRTTLHKDWACKYLGLLENPDELASDPEYRALAPLQKYDAGNTWYPSDAAAYNVLQFYAFVKGDSLQMLEWNIAVAMLIKGGEWFEELYPRYVALKGAIPAEVEEAHQVFSNPSFGDARSARGTYAYFYYNENIRRPN